jgi:signal transduction histidine kinase
MKKRTPGLRSRLLVLVGGGLLGLMLGQYAATALMMNEREEEMIDALLVEQIQYSMQLYHQAGKVLTPNVPRMTFYAYPVSAPGAEVPREFLAFGPGSHEVDIGDTEYHFVVHDEDDQRFLLAYDVEQYEENFTELMAVLGISFLMSVAVSLSGIYWLSGKALSSLLRLDNAVRSQSPGPFVQDDMEAEVLALAEALDGYRARQTLLLEREREFSGHLSHELRTPLSVVRGQAELTALQYPDDERLQARAAEIIAQADRMRGMIEQLLRLARSARVPVRETVTLQAMVERIWADLLQTGHSRTVLRNMIAADVRVVADPLLLELILRNALSNARLHADGAELRLSFDQDVLVIEDYAEAAAPSPLPVSDNEGLGLAILRRACAVLGWECHFATLPTGTRLMLRLR